MLLRKHLRWLVLGLALSLIAAGGAGAAGRNKLKVKTPKSVKLGKTFKVVTSGRATGKADFVVGIAINSPCKSTYSAEYVAAGRPSTVPLARQVHGKFRKVRKVRASLGGRVYWCAYLINRTSAQTYRHKSKHWTEHS
jgi:hypothetical protein